MSILLSCRGLSKSFGSRPLFENLSFGLFEGGRVGLIGPNGAGKSTLLKILAGLESPDRGEVSPRRGLRLAWLGQQDRFSDAGPGGTVKAELERSLAGLGLEPHEAERKVLGALAEAGFSDPDENPASLSGGRSKRLAVLGQVLREPDLLLLDEPTNHLDLEGVLWLEGFLSSLKFSYLVVTHDRRFLERTCNRIIELDKRYEDGHFSSEGPYSRFLEKREELFSAQRSQADSLANIVRGEIEWLRKGPKARTTKQQARIARAGGLMGDLAELNFRNAQTRSAAIEFNAGERQTRKLIEAGGVEKSLGGRRLFGPLSLRLGPGDRLGLLGANGSGKSTLLKLLAGETEPDAGQIKRAEGLQVAYFDQHRDRLDLSMSLKQALCGNGEHVQFRGKAIHVAGWASRFLFRAEQLDFPLSRLSGGEQARVLIARLMLRPADVLLLDEPTNDLDLRSLEVLESSLRDFPGALVLVTHDRFLLDRVSRELLALDGKGGANFYADLSQWEEAQKEAGPAPAAAPKKETKAPLSSKERRELKGMEETIHAAEGAAEALRLELEDPAVAADAAELGRRHAAFEAARARIDALFKRWEELEARG